MMKKNFYILFALFILLLPINIFAATNSLIVNCTSEIKPGDNIVCELSASTSASISSFEIPFSVSTGVSANSMSLADTNTMFGNSVYGNKLDISLLNNTTGNFKIGTLTFTTTQSIPTGNANISFNNIIFNDDNFQKISIPSVSKSVVVKSTESGNGDSGSSDNGGGGGNGGNSGNAGNNSNNGGSNNTNNNTNTNTNSNNNTNTNNNTNNKPNDVITDEPDTITDSDNVDDDINKPYLLDLLIENYELDFSKEVFEYKLKIKDENELYINPVLEDTSSEYEIIENENLRDGSVIQVVVSNGTKERIYKILIEKALLPKSKSNILFICIIVVLLAINVIRIVNKKKNTVGEEV